MREILFRGWDAEKKIMLNCDTLCFCQGGIKYSDGCTTDKWAYRNKGFDNIRQATIILEQFTGLLDKNGTKIFEGDICKSQSGMTHLDGRRAKGESIVTYQIGFCDGHFSEFKLSDNNWKNYKSEDFAPSTMYKSVVGKYFEVIGNIHENPELLEVET